LFDVVFVARFFGDEEREAERETGGVDFEEPARVNEYDGLAVVTPLRFLLIGRVDLSGSADDEASVLESARTRVVPTVSTFVVGVLRVSMMVY
jgi:hypothetical protein